MKKNVLLGCLMVLSSLTTFASTDAQIEKAMNDLGIQQDAKAIAVHAGPAWSINENGQEVFSLEVMMIPQVGSANSTAKDIKIYESDKKTMMVMTYNSGYDHQSLNIQTKIIEVKSEASKVLAKFIKANTVAVDESTGQLKLKVYSAKEVSCERPSYPGAETTCSVTK